MRRHSSTGASTTGPSSITPALLTRMSRRPWAVTTWSTIARAWASSVTSVGTTSTRSPTDAVGQGLETLHPAGGHGHLRPFLGQGHRGRLADAARGPRDQGHRPVQSSRHRQIPTSRSHGPHRSAVSDAVYRGGPSTPDGPGRPEGFRRPSAGCDAASCGVGPAVGSRGRTADRWTPGSRGARTTRCCCTATGAPGTTARCTPCPSRRTRGGSPPTALRPASNRPRSSVVPPCHPTPRSPPEAFRPPDCQPAGTPCGAPFWRVHRQERIRT